MTGPTGPYYAQVALAARSERQASFGSLRIASNTNQASAKALEFAGFPLLREMGPDGLRGSAVDPCSRRRLLARCGGHDVRVPAAHRPGNRSRGAAIHAAPPSQSPIQ